MRSSEFQVQPKVLCISLFLRLAHGKTSMLEEHQSISCVWEHSLNLPSKRVLKDYMVYRFKIIFFSR